MLRYVRSNTDLVKIGNAILGNHLMATCNTGGYPHLTAHL